MKVTQQDGDEAISSPIVMTGEASGGSVSARVAAGSDDAEQRQTGSVVPP